MPFIKIQKLKRDQEGTVIAGSASLVDTSYDPHQKSGHSVQKVREKLGKVLFYDSESKTGIFLSPTRGMVEYCSKTDAFADVDMSDPRLPKSFAKRSSPVHTVFGDAWFLLSFLKNSELYGVLQEVFEKKSDFQRLICHVLHGVLKDGSKITCEDWVGKSFASYLADEVPLHTLKSDTRFFSAMGEDEARMRFFKAFVKLMRRKTPDFGKACFVDSTPLPNDTVNNPFNALCSHGIGSCTTMVRLVLVLDEATGLPVWYDIIPGNVLDISTLMTVVNDVAASLNITIDNLVLDAGYISRELVQACCVKRSDAGEIVPAVKTFLGRMPAKKGYPFKELYHKVKPLLSRQKYSLIRGHHLYFGHKNTVQLFGAEEFAYVFVDQNNALRSFTQYRLDHSEDYEKLKDKDKDWLSVKYGYFVLLSNLDLTPAEILDRYFERTQIETVFKTSKEYLDILPLSKWTDAAVRGKILADVIDTIVLLTVRKQLSSKSISTTEMFGRLSSLMCFMSGGRVIVEPPSKKVKEYLGEFKLQAPRSVGLEDWKLDAA